MDIITKGGNYGWATYEGSNSPPSGVTTNGQPVAQNPIFPILTYAHGSGTNRGDCIIGGVVYRGSRFPQLTGSYVFGDNVSGNFWTLTYDGTNATTPRRLFTDAGVSGFGIDPSNGDVLYANLQNGNNSVIKRIISTNSIPYFSTMELSDTNLIVSGTNGAPNGKYYLLAGTNATQPLASWTMLATNLFDANGGFRFTNSVDQTEPQRFFILLLP